MSNNWYFLKVNGIVKQVDFSYEPNIVNEEWDNIPAEQFLSVKEIADHQLAELKSDDLKFFREVEEKELITLHHSYGRWVRNSYALWHPNNPFVIPDDLDDGHPDGLSMLVIKEIHKRCNRYDAFQDAMSIVQEK